MLMAELHPIPDYSKMSREEIGMLKIKAFMCRKTVEQYIIDLAKEDNVELKKRKRYCLDCHQEVEMMTERVTEYVYPDRVKEVLVTDFPAEKCPICGSVTINGGLAAEVEVMVEGAGEYPEKVSFNNLLYGIIA